MPLPQDILRKVHLMLLTPMSAITFRKVAFVSIKSASADLGSQVVKLWRLPVQVLVRVHADVIAHLANPHLLSDFLTRALDTGGLNGMLALHGIFTLVTQHGLEYPRFYARLYGLLAPATLMVRCSQAWRWCKIKLVGSV